MRLLSMPAWKPASKLPRWAPLSSAKASSSRSRKLSRITQNGITRLGHPNSIIMLQDTTRTSFTDVFIKHSVLMTSLTKLWPVLRLQPPPSSVTSADNSVGHRHEGWHDLHLIRRAGILFTDPRATSAA